ncbi:Mannonate dehydratase [bioreactor metagenome]|uniref:mannonate dehydratase n=1 Tax=bioreactor metagenome TaxID=1076179 RepID=A0A645BYR4_9ZZZZ|nr:mannonate dehydratase [Paludibacter sp.]
MKLSFLFFSDQPDNKWILTQQMGIRFAIAKLAPELTGKNPPWDFSSLKSSKDQYYANGFDLIGLEGDQMDMMRIKLGLPGRDEDIERYKQMLRNMGRLNISLLCYNFMATGWFRTNKMIPERGGAVVTGYDAEKAKLLPDTPYGKFSKQQIWDNYIYFINKVMPVAEENGVKMALHPDDPPVPELQGIARIFINADAIREALSLSNSSSHGLTFCQGTYKTMNEDLPSLIEEFGRENKIFFLHIRDVEGHRFKFRETFHDNGPTNMPEMFALYKKVGFNGPIRSDHVPTMAGESNQHAGYEINGNLFGIGYIRGIMDTLNISYM